MILKAEAFVRDGWVRPVDEDRWECTLEPHNGKRVVVTVEQYRDRRTLRQNARYWVAIVPAVARHLSTGRPFELHPDQAHYLLKCAFLGVIETPMGPVAKRSRDLTTAEFSDYCDRIEAHAASEWGLSIPHPGDE